MHILPQLRKLEEAFPEEVVVLGVHSASSASVYHQSNRSLGSATFASHMAELRP